MESKDVSYQNRKQFKHPKIKWNRKPEDFEKNQKTQIDLLEGLVFECRKKSDYLIRLFKLKNRCIKNAKWHLITSG